MSSLCLVPLRAVVYKVTECRGWKHGLPTGSRLACSPHLLNAHWLSEGPQQSCREWPERRCLQCCYRETACGMDAIWVNDCGYHCYLSPCLWKMQLNFKPNLSRRESTFIFKFHSFRRFWTLSLKSAHLCSQANLLVYLHQPPPVFASVYWLGYCALTMPWAGGAAGNDRHDLLRGCSHSGDGSPARPYLFRTLLSISADSIMTCWSKFLENKTKSNQPTISSFSPLPTPKRGPSDNTMLSTHSYYLHSFAFS